MRWQGRKRDDLGRCEPEEIEMRLFGENPIEQVALVSQLVAGVSSQVTPESTRTVRTEAVKSSLRSLGKSLGRTVAPDPTEQQPEFMLDLVWFRNKKSIDIDLAVESEWGKAVEILNDFEKLLPIKAPLKLMVYESSDRRSSRRNCRILENIYWPRSWRVLFAS
jgi:hypothetical protein